MSNCQDSCQTNSWRYDDVLSGCLMYCGETVRPSEKLSEGAKMKLGQRVDFLGRRCISTSGFAYMATETAVFAVWSAKPCFSWASCLHWYLLFYYQFWVDIFCHCLCDYIDLFHKWTQGWCINCVVRKVIGDSGMVALGTMGEQRGTPMPIELHWIVLSKFVYLCPEYLVWCFRVFLAELICTT